MRGNVGTLSSKQLFQGFAMISKSLVATTKTGTLTFPADFLRTCSNTALLGFPSFIQGVANSGRFDTALDETVLPERVRSDVIMSLFSERCSTAARLLFPLQLMVPAASPIRKFRSL